ncbi:MAG TPA: protein-(glutamine-N5) methyltransferase, release factor-specific, partial [Flavobacteriales bacterium]|nr:protein-(glutamine-N5) methyltransferase, release factor-specific [Flavobacteriales bacterium]
SKDALDVAVINARKHGVTIKFQLLDILNESYTREFFANQKPFDIIVSNPPYITLSEKKKLGANVLDFEPHTALFAHENDALIFYRRINELAGSLLKAGGQLYYEINEFKGGEMMDLMKKHNFNEVELINDINAKNRIIKAVK